MVDINQMVTDKICELLEHGVIPWRRPWTGCFPTNYDSGKEYQGINTLMLGGAALAEGYKSPYWLTYNQAKKHGGYVKAGERSSIIVWKESGYYKSKGEDGTETLKPYFYMKYFRVFNLEQCQGVPEKTPNTWNTDIDQDVVRRCEAVIRNMPTPPRLAIGQEAAYHPRTDILEIPAIEYFKSTEAYYSTKYHELIHSTGAAHRLNRPGVVDGARFGSHKYSFEELTAEMGSAYLCARAGIDCHEITENSAAYVGSWLRVLKADKTALLRAAGKSSAAVDYIITGKIPMHACQATPMAIA